jgi:hypothetical protein
MSASATTVGVRPRRGVTTRPGRLANIAGVGALAAAVLGSAWIAIGTAGGRRWLELSTPASVRWIEGPLHALAGGAGALPESELGLALILLAAAYLVALACASAIPLRLALGAVILANAAFMLGPTLVSSDVFGYIAYGRELARHGLNPYVSAPSALGHDAILQFVYWTHQQSPYGPLFTILSAPLGLLSPAAALWAFKALAGLASVAIAVLVARIAPERGLQPSRAVVFVGLNPVLLFYAVSGAHNDLLGVLLIVCALALTARGRELGGAGVAVGAAAIKVTLGLALPFVVLLARRRGRALNGAALATAVLAVPTLILFGIHVFDQLHKITGDARFDIAGSGPDVLARLLGTHITPAIRALCTGGAALAAAAALVWAWRGADPIAAAGWAFAALLASIASLAPWYLVWLLPLAALGRNRTLWVATLIATGYLLGIHLPAFGANPWLSGA